MDLLQLLVMHVCPAPIRDKSAIPMKCVYICIYIYIEMLN
jgi:hypothetical protein